MMIEELGYGSTEPNEYRAALATLAAFLTVGFLPLLVFVYDLAAPGDVDNAFTWSAVMTGIAFLVVGGMKSRFVDQSWWRSALETLLVGGPAAVLAYAAGALLQAWHEQTVVTALLFGIAVSSSLVIGAVIGSRWGSAQGGNRCTARLRERSAHLSLAFELFEKAFRHGGATRSGLVDVDAADPDAIAAAPIRTGVPIVWDWHTAYCSGQRPGRQALPPSARLADGAGLRPSRSPGCGQVADQESKQDQEAGGEDEAHGWRVEAQAGTRCSGGCRARRGSNQRARPPNPPGGGKRPQRCGRPGQGHSRRSSRRGTRTKTGRAVIAATCGEGRGVERFDGRAVWCGKRNVHRRRGLAFRDEEINAPEVEAHRAFRLGHLDSERCKRGLVELRARRYVTDWDGEVVDEKAMLLDCTDVRDYGRTDFRAPSVLAPCDGAQSRRGR